MNMQITKTRAPLWACLLLLMLLVVGLFWDSERSPVPIPTANAPLMAPGPNPTSQPLGVRYELPAMEPPSDTAAAPTLETPGPVGDTLQSPVAAQESARLAVFGKENAVYEKATRLFEAEPVDVEWATGYEQALREMFGNHPGLLRVSVNTISCRSSMCRIEVFTPRDTDADYFTAMFYNALDNFREGALKAEASIARRMEQGVTSVYIARNGHTLGFY